MRSRDLSGPIRGQYSHLQGDDVLCCVFLLVDDDAPVHEDVIKQEELQALLTNERLVLRLLTNERRVLPVDDLSLGGGSKIGVAGLTDNFIQGSRNA